MGADRTGYEIRENLLHLAFELTKVNAEMAYSASKRLEKVGDTYAEFHTWTPFTVDDVVDQAKKLNDFVSQK